MKRFLLIILLLLCCFVENINAQLQKQLQNLNALYRQSSSDSEKVIALGKLADLYYTYKLNQQGDSILKEQLLVAELSDNNNLVFLALFGESISNISETATAKSFDKVVAFLEKGIDFAKSQNQYNYLALGYSRMSNILRKRGENEKALYYATQALQLIPNIKADTIKAEVYIEIGNAFLAKGEAVSAVRNFNNAFDVAIKIKSIKLQSEVYHNLAMMYYIFLKNPEIAKELLKKSLRINKENKNFEGQVRDYYDLARVTDEITYWNKCMQLSDSLHYYRYILEAKILRLYYIFVVEKNSDKAIKYLETEPEIKASFTNAGYGNYYQIKGHIYAFADKYDSALVYFKLAEYDFLKNFDPKRSRGLFKSIANAYEELNDFSNAIAYNLKALELSEATNDVKSIAEVSKALSRIYEQSGDFKQAFVYSKQAKKFTDSLDNLSKARDIALLDIERENRRHEDELRELAQKQENKRYVQYMAITIAIGVVFIIMLIIGTFPVSKLTIKILGYIFFISLFEFIVLLIDTFLHNITHGEPLKIWLIKIFLIALLVPVQHYLEHTLIKFLESRKLLHARTNFSIKKLINKIKKPAQFKEAGIEEGTAVL